MTGDVVFGCAKPRPAAMVERVTSKKFAVAACPQTRSGLLPSLPMATGTSSKYAATPEKALRLARGYPVTIGRGSSLQQRPWS